MSLSALGSLNQTQLAALMQQQAFQQQLLGQQAIAAASTFTNCYTTSSASTGTVWVNASTGTVTCPPGGSVVLGVGSGALGVPTHQYGSGNIKVVDGCSSTIELPDGTIIDIKADGSYTIQDKDAKVVYRASRLRDFNPFINVSDRLEEFIEFCGKQGVKQGEMLELPINLFIGWLVISAAKHDREPEPDIKLLPDLRKHSFPRCIGCGRFIPHTHKIKKLEFCAPVCFDRHYMRQIAA